jgi:AcrR family transcriptional regulator
MIRMTGEKNEKKAAIAGAAVRLFTERGFHGTPTSLIAREAGVSNGTLFHYFPTKEDLINFAYFEIKNRMAEEIGRGVDAERTERERMRRMWRNAVLWGVDHPSSTCSSSSLLVPFVRRLPPEEFLKDAPAVFESLTGTLGKSCLEGIPIEVAFAVISSPIDAVIRSIINPGGNLDRDRLIDASFEIIWRGLTGE